MSHAGLAPLAELQARWCAALDSLYAVACDTDDPAQRAQILARADQLSECDLDLRRARRELLGLVSRPQASAPNSSDVDRIACDSPTPTAPDATP